MALASKALRSTCAAARLGVFRANWRRVSKAETGPHFSQSRVFVTMVGVSFRPLTVRRGYADIGAKDDKTEVHLNFSAAEITLEPRRRRRCSFSTLTGAILSRHRRVTTNRMTMVSLNGQVKATPTLTFSGVSYYRWFQQVHADANLADAFECNVPPGPGTGTLCLNDPDVDNEVLDGNGNTGSSGWRPGLWARSRRDRNHGPHLPKRQ